MEITRWLYTHMLCSIFFPIKKKIVHETGQGGKSWSRPWMLNFPADRPDPTKRTEAPGRIRSTGRPLANRNFADLRKSTARNMVGGPLRGKKDNIRSCPGRRLSVLAPKPHLLPAKNLLLPLNRGHSQIPATETASVPSIKSEGERKKQGKKKRKNGCLPWILRRREGRSSRKHLPRIPQEVKSEQAPNNFPRFLVSQSV